MMVTKRFLVIYREVFALKQREETLWISDAAERCCRNSAQVRGDAFIEFRQPGKSHNGTEHRRGRINKTQFFTHSGAFVRVIGPRQDQTVRSEERRVGKEC